MWTSFIGKLITRRGEDMVNEVASKTIKNKVVIVAKMLLTKNNILLLGCGTRFSCTLIK